jgi:hypothetical protein
MHRKNAAFGQNGSKIWNDFHNEEKVAFTKVQAIGVPMNQLKVI